MSWALVASGLLRRRAVMKNLIPALVVSIAVAGVAFAAVNAFVDVEPELSTRTGNVAAISDGTASGGTALKFGQSPTASCPLSDRLTITSANHSTYPGYPIGTKVYVPDGPDPWGGCFPGPSSTGIPAGVTLTNWTGGCDIRTANIVIDAKLMTGCDQFYVNAVNVTIKNSKIVTPNLFVQSGNLIITDTEADFGPDEQGQAMTGSYIVGERLNFHGGHREAVCDHCTIKDSYFHDQNLGTNLTAHVSAVKNDSYTSYIHNSIGCTLITNADGGGCSASITGYPDSGPIYHNTMDKNLIWSGDAGYCVYGGWNPGKPYNDDPLNTTYVQFSNNVVARGNQPNEIQELALDDPNRYTCGYWGPVTSFQDEAEGYKFYDNMWDDGLLWRDDTGFPFQYGFPPEVR